ncbi:MAG: ABC transporter permease, partial [Tannerellaceae bacterium]|nr:ABC transporter permease [Tannerellaceae bacterium]
MKTILRNFLSTLRRFKMATALNVLGLSVAFAAFMMIMMQVGFDYGFDRSQPHADRIFRMEPGNLMRQDWSAIINRPLMEAFIASSPHIEAGAYTKQPLAIYFSVEANGAKNNFQENALEVSSGYTDVFHFDMIEGSNRALDEPNQVLIPLSLADKLFGSEPALGKRLDADDVAYTVGGVYRDFPLNTSTSNVIYLLIPREENLYNWGNWNYAAYIRVNDPANAAGLIENFQKTFDASGLEEWVQNNITEINFRLTPLPEVHFITGVAYDRVPKASRQTLLILFCIAIVIVVIAGINYMNFSTALTPKRIR